MTEQLPIITKSNAVTTSGKPASSLLGRGLAAIQNKKTDIAQLDLDTRYRQARDIYNRITDYGEETRFKIELLPTEEQLLEEPLLQQLQPFYNHIKKLAEIFTVFQELAIQGYGRAYFPLCLMYKGGQGVIQDIEKSECYGKLAFNWCFENQILNDPEIWCDLGFQYFWSDYYIANSLWYKAAEQASIQAQSNLGGMYESGLTETMGELSAIFWSPNAAKQSCSEMQNKWVGIKRNEEEAIFWYRRAAEQGHPRAQNSIGLFYDERMNFKEAVQWYRKSAEQDDTYGQFRLAEMYEYGEGVEKNLQHAVFWFNRAAKQGYEDAQYSLGRLYEYGEGLEKSFQQTIFWYHQAAKQGNEEAQEKLTELGINWQEK